MAKRSALAQRAVWTSRRLRRLVRIRHQWRLADKNVERDVYLQLQRTLWIRPRDVVFFSGLHVDMHRQEHLGLVLDGDWDMVGDERQTDTYMTVASLRDNVRGVPWPQTSYYRFHKAQLDEGTCSAFSSVEDLERSCNWYREMYEKVSAHGYLTQAQLAWRSKSGQMNSPAYEILVAVGRDGDLMFVDAQHRFAAAYVADVPRIPVQVCVRHPLWMDFRREIERYAVVHGGRVPQPLLHPDLDSIPSARDCAVRFELTAQAFPAGSERLLDLTPSWGYDPQRAGPLGLRATAVADDPQDAYFMRRLKRACRSEFAVVDGPMLHDETFARERFDVVLALDRLHRYARTRDHYDAFTNLLARLAPRAMVIEPPTPHDMISSDLRSSYSPTGFARSVAQRSGFSVVRSLGSVDRREIFALSRN